MGRTLAQWRTQVLQLVRDAGNLDVSTAQVDDVGIIPALNLYSIDRPRMLVVEQAGTGSAYLALPTGWVAGFSSIESVEHPARQNPPSVLDAQSWRLVRSVADVAVEQILLLGATPSAAEWVRTAFSAAWPTPTGTATDDKVDDIAFHAVCHLAAAFSLQHLSAEAARARGGALPTSFVDGAERARSLISQAKECRAVYDRFLGRTSAGGAGDAGPGPSSRAFDFDPGYDSMFHGRRR